MRLNAGFPKAWPSGAAAFRRALILLWLADGLLILAFIAARVLVFIGVIRFVPDMLAISREYSIPESFNYAKWALCVLCLVTAWFRSRAALFGLLALIFAMIFADDAFLGHETLGAWLAEALALGPAIGLDAKHIGELAIFVAMGGIALALIAAGYRLSPRAYWGFLHRFLLVIAGLAVTGGLFDALHHMSSSLPDGRIFTLIRLLLTLVEDGGEMLLASLAAAYAVGAAWLPAPSEELPTGGVSAAPLAARPVPPDSPDRRD